MAIQTSATTDPRARVFCSYEGPDIFRSIAFPNEISTPDPLDVPTIYAEARDTFERLIDRATDGDGNGRGSILLLRGESGSGKTHLMRALRNRLHEQGRGYFGYMQMCTAVVNYDQYILSKLIDSLEQPYTCETSEQSGLMRLSTAIAQHPCVPRDTLHALRESTETPAERAALVDSLVDGLLAEPAFRRIDLDLLRVMLHLQADDPGIYPRALKFLRAERLGTHDRERLGEVGSHDRDDAAARLIHGLGVLIAHCQPPARSSLVICVDQMEDMIRGTRQEGAERFSRAIQSLRSIAEHLPSAVVIVSCISDYYVAFRQGLDKSTLDRIESDPEPIDLARGLTDEEVKDITATHLQFLFDTAGVAVERSTPLFPFAEEELLRKPFERPRALLQWCRSYRESCIAAGQIIQVPGTRPDDRGGTVDPAIEGVAELEASWSDHQTTAPAPADEEVGQARIFADAVDWLSEELDDTTELSADREDEYVTVRIRDDGRAHDPLLVRVCNRSARGGGLGSQVAELQERAKDGTPEARPIVLRSTEFPKSPKAKVSKQLGQLIADGGRRLMVADAEWRAMLAMRTFRQENGTSAAFGAWLRQSRPLSHLRSLRDALALEELLAKDEPSPRPIDKPTPSPEAEVVDVGPERNGNDRQPREDQRPAGHLRVGTTNERQSAEMWLRTSDLTRHAAFLGGTGSGKTTAALNLIEQLLLEGVPVLLVDRKGDLCRYADEAAYGEPIADPELDARRKRLRDEVDVAVYTPGHPQGRPLSLSILPGGMSDVSDFEREQLAHAAAAALATMLEYRGARASAKKAIIGKAIELLSCESDDPIDLAVLRDYLQDQDPGFINALGMTNIRVIPQIADDLSTLMITRSRLFDRGDEALDIDSLLGKGPHARPGKTNLSIVSTKFLVDNVTVLFWVTQLLVSLSRWMSRRPSDQLQAVVLFDEADIYLPAGTRKPSTKQPMEDLLRRGRSAGLGVFLASQNPGDFDYKCRDNINTWFVGRIRENRAIEKMRPMLRECRLDVESRLAGQDVGEFFLSQAGAVTATKSNRNVIETRQLREDEILSLASASRRR